MWITEEILQRMKNSKEVQDKQRYDRINKKIKSINIAKDERLESKFDEIQVL